MVEGRDKKGLERDTFRPGAEFEPPTLVGKKTLAETGAPAVLETAVSRPQAMGLPWADVLAAAPPLGVRLRALVETLHALSVIHTNLVRPPAERCHGALSPDSVLVTADGSASIFWQSARDPSRLEPYIAPEVRAGSHPDQQADIYSVGVMLYEALTGRRPTEVNNQTQDLGGGNDQLFALTRIALRAISAEPERRWRTALLFADAISQNAGALLLGRETLAQAVAHGVSRQERRLRELALESLRTPVAAPIAQGSAPDTASDSFHALVTPALLAESESELQRRSRRARVVRGALLASLVLFSASVGYVLMRPKPQVDVAAAKPEAFGAMQARRNRAQARDAAALGAPREAVSAPEPAIDLEPEPASTTARPVSKPIRPKAKTSGPNKPSFEPEGI